MTDKKHNSLVFWIKCVDALGILILASPWVDYGVYNLVFGIYGDSGASVDPTRYIGCID